MKHTCPNCKHINKDRGAITISIGYNYTCDNCGKLFSYREKGLPIASVYDIDGTLAFFDHTQKERQPHTGEEPVNTDVLTYLQETKKRKHVIIILTGRKRKEWGDLTLQWLKDNEIYHDQLIMQEGSVGKKGPVFKEEVLKELKKKYHIHCVVDDDGAMEQVCLNLEINFLRVDSQGNIIL